MFEAPGTAPTLPAIAWTPRILWWGFGAGLLPPQRSRAYRPEIDGLRAVAVIGALIHPLDPDWLPGGFLVVDIVFVISGYEVTALL